MSARRLPLIALLLANTISLIGEALTMIAIPWYVYETTGSATKMGLVGAFTFLPRIIATFFGGAIVDRVGFTAISILADTMSGIAVALIPLIHHTLGLSFPVLIALVFLGAFFDGPGQTARESLVPELARLANIRLERVNAIYQLVRRLAEFVGPALAGVLIAVLGASNVLWIDAITFGISILLIGLFVPRRLHATTDAETDVAPATSYWGDLVAGLRFIWDDQLLRWLAISLAITNFLDAPLSSVTLPVFVREDYGGVERLGVLLTVFGIGATLSSMIFAAIGHRFPRYHVFTLSFIFFGLPYLALAAGPSYAVALIVVFAFGLGAGTVNPILMTVRQERVPEKIRARIFGTFTSIALIAIPLGQLIGGVVVEQLGPHWALAFAGIGYLLAGISMRLNPALRTMATPAPIPA